MNAKQLTASILLSALLLGGFTGCETNKSKDNMVQTKEKVFTKKYTNADFYVDGKFNGEVALKAYLEMFEFYGVPFTDFMKENMWISDFGLGDFEHAGMAGVFWVNDPVNRHFGHEIYL